MHLCGQWHAVVCAIMASCVFRSFRMFAGNVPHGFPQGRARFPPQAVWRGLMCYLTCFCMFALSNFLQLDLHVLAQCAGHLNALRMWNPAAARMAMDAFRALTCNALPATAMHGGSPCSASHAVLTLQHDSSTGISLHGIQRGMRLSMHHLQHGGGGVFCHSVCSLDVCSLRAHEQC
jgi:hypothetical protein